MGELAVSADTAIAQCQGEKEEGPKDRMKSGQDGGDIWGVALSSEGALCKTQGSDEAVNEDGSDRSKKMGIRKSKIFKDFVEATSPVLSPLLPQLYNKEAQQNDGINISEATVKQLTSETNCRAGSYLSPENARKDVKPVENNKLSNKRKVSLEEINKRRKEESKKVSKQTKDDSSKSARGACPVCGMTNADGLRTVCKSCISLKKDSKSKENALLKKKKTTKNVADEGQTKPDKPDNTPEKESSAEKSDETPAGGETTGKNRSLSLDLNDSTTESLAAFTSKKYRPPKRTSTDLGLNDYNSKILDAKLSQFKDSPSDTTQSSTNASEQEGHDVKFGPANLELEQKRDKKQTSQTMKPESKLRMLKRSTTDSEIVSKGKGVKDDKKQNPDSKIDNKVPSFGTKRIDPSKPIKMKREHSVSSMKSESPDESRDMGMVSSYRLERSKTVLGKVNFEPEKRGSAEALENFKTEEGGSSTPDNEKTAQAEAKKNLFKSVRSHTIIGDGLAKRKQRQDSSKFKSGKREGSSVNGKKKIDGKPQNEPEEDKKAVTFMEGEAPKKPTIEELVVVNDVMPKTLYDLEHEDDSSDSESEEEESEEEESTASQIRRNKPIVEPKIPEKPKVVKPVNEKRVKNSWKPTSDMMSYQPVSRMTDYGNDYGNSYGTYDYTGDSSYENEQHVATRMEIPEQHDSVFRPGYSIEGGADSYENKMDRVHNTQNLSQEDQGYKYSIIDVVDEEEEEEDADDESDENEAVYASDNADDAYYVDANCSIYPGYREPENTEIVKAVNYYEIDYASGREAKSEDYGLSYTHYDPYTISRSGKDIGDEVDEDVSYKSQLCYDRMPAEYTEDFTINREVAIPAKEVCEQEYFGYETDVDTGLPVARTVAEVQEHYTTVRKNEWGFGTSNDSYSSSSSDESDTEEEDEDNAWYTGGFFSNKSKSSTSENKDSIYFNDQAGVQLSDSDIYTGDIFSKADPKVIGIGDMSRNNNVSIEESLCSRSQFRNNISSCPQMHPARSAKDVFAHTGDGYLSTFLNLSNNGIYDDEEDYIPALTSNKETPNKPKQMVLNRSDYTEYNSKPKTDLILFGNTDFSKYDNPRAKDYRQKPEDIFSGRIESPKADIVFFGESNKKPKPYTLSVGPEQSLYFNGLKPMPVNYDHTSFEREHENRLDRDESYQGGFFYASRYGNMDSNNNNGGRAEEDFYTGCFRNEEEYKPTHEGLFNDKPTSFNFKKRTPNVDTLYFSNSNSKTYYDIEDSVYAFEQKEKPCEKKLEKPKITKVGGIVVRNNVECEVDYAQNINMDLQATSWRRYDMVGDGEASDGYAKNILFEEMSSSRPWQMEDCRAPWKVPKTQSNVAGKIKPDNTKWKAPDKVVKSVKTLGTYVTKWF